MPEPNQQKNLFVFPKENLKAHQEILPKKSHTIETSSNLS